MIELADILAKDKGAGKLINVVVMFALIAIWVISQVFTKREREKTGAFPRKP